MMNSQINPPGQVEKEKQIVRDVAGLADDDIITFIDSGWDSRVYAFANFRYFFKFPRSQKIQKRYIQEIACLKLLRGQVSGIQFPTVLWEGVNSEYFGYEGVQGYQLNTVINTLDSTTKKSIGSELGVFLKLLHGLELDGARSISIEQEIEQFQEWFTPARPLLKNELSFQEYALLEKLVNTTWPDDLLRLGATHTLCHRDLHLPNILYDKASKQLSIIDFGDVGYCDNSKDFVDLGNGAINSECLRTYGADDILKEKIGLRQKTSSILTLTYHIGKQNKTGIKTQLDTIKRSLRSYA